MAELKYNDENFDDDFDDFDDYDDTKTEASGDNDVATDDYYRIPAIMQDCKTAYSLSWQGAIVVTIFAEV